MSRDRDIKRNGSGCYDPTAYKAIQNISIEEKRSGELMKAIKIIIRLAGFEIVGRVTLRDLETGKEFK